MARDSGTDAWVDDLPYKRLQSAAKALGICATGAAETLRARVRDKLAENRRENRAVENRDAAWEAQKWRPGQSGNPKGRPKGRTATEIIRDLGNTTKTVRVDGEEQTMTLQEIVIMGFWQQLTGNAANKKVGKIDIDIFRELFGRTDPKPKATEEEKGEDEPTILEMSIAPPKPIKRGGS